jgi:CheY-like chemotaxis protein
MQKTMLSCFYPTTVVFIDDKQNYLNSLVAAIDYKHIVPKLFSNPIQAVEFIKQQTPYLQHSVLTPLEEQPADHVGFDINIRDFHKKILQNHRFNELTVVVCDYAMPQQNGLEVLQQIKNPELKTIMLTGEADEALAVNAFNRGLIDHFIHKNIPDFSNTLNKTILSLQQEYIRRATSLMVDNIILGKMPSPCCLNDPAYIDLFKKIKAHYDIVEDYIIDENGSFLLLDAKGNAYFLVIMDEPTLESYAEFAVDSAAPEALINTLRSQEFIPFFYSEDDFNTHPNDWENYLHPAKTFEGARKYFYSLIKPNDFYKPEIVGLESYQQFLSQYKP